MKTDRELLEMAAKAAGLPMCEEWDCAADGDGILIGAGNGDLKPWNPLTDDGDALRLAVRLQISVCQNIIRVEASTIQLVLDGVKIHEDTMNQDWCLSTRRAIVRAAAAIGSAM